jgi:opacity protein-like surface antigen
MSYKLIAMTSLALLAANASALGADMPDLPAEPLPPAPVVEPAPKFSFGDGWYLRGDIGYVMVDVDVEADLKVPYWDTRLTQDGVDTENFWNADPMQLTDRKVEDSWMFGGGIGYDFGWVRVDGTVDYALASEVSAIRRPTIFGRRGSQFSTYDAYVCEGDANCSAKEIGEVDRLTFLANAYVDLGEYWGITPYIGAGAGFARVGWDWETRETCYNTCEPGYPTRGASQSQTIKHEGQSDWSLAYALMAGASYRIDDNLLLDLGYRYLVVEDGDAVAHVRGTKAGELVGYPSANKKPTELGAIEFKDLVNQEFRVGLRYEFGSF